MFQVQDPWPTSWYGAVWRQSIPRDIVLGNTVGEAYEKGISHVGTLYLPEEPQWWWDTMESVVYFGDPDLRMYVPDTTYSDGNNWEKVDTMPLRYDAELLVDGHMPFGAVDYPHEKETVTLLQQYLWIITALVLIIILLIIARLLGRKQRSRQ